MAAAKGPNIVRNGLVLAVDAANEQSFRGIPTENLLANSGMSTYNNVSGDVTSVLVSTSETYRGAVVWKQTLTATTASGVSWLSGGQNPGIGVVTGGGGGLANRYTGHSIFFKPTVPMHSSPIFTQYSNIGGWQSCCNFDDMGDGWFRAHVIWFNTVNGNDGKYWAINPLLSTINVPVDIYWAGPFKEDRNDSSVVSPFVNGTRGTTFATGGGWADRSGNSNHGELVNGPSFNSSNLGGISFDGVNDRVDVARNLGTLSNYSIMFWARRDSENRMPIAARTDTRFYWYGDNSWFYTHGGVGGEYYYSKPTSIPINTWGCYAVVYNGSNVSIYRQGIFQGSQNTSGTANWTDGLMLGYWAAAGPYAWNGLISTVLFYNIALTATEIQQNYNATRRRFGL